MKWDKRLVAVTSGLTGGLALAATPAWAGLGELNLPYGVTSIAHMNYDLNMLVLWITIFIGIIVFGAMGYSMYHHRKSQGATAAQFHHNTTIEIVWTVIPLLILVGMAIAATRGLVLMYDTDNADMDIKVTGYQWQWRYDYLGEGVSFYSKLDEQSNQARELGSSLQPERVDNYLRNVDKPLVVPINTKIRFLITAEDVIHAWWVPEFGWKMDAIPGFVNKAWAKIEQPGVYRGQCAELCGRDHAFMPIVVIAKTPEEYKKWLAEEKKRQGAAEGAEQAAAEPSPAVDVAQTQS
ncbi:MAG: cytochrome c oxidase subunit II [Nitrococcus mobilis]|nr:cytochrome c oxidase subunit II [Nitrococcus mobilis]